jgi:pyruvate formate lyase activating enzyme
VGEVWAFLSRRAGLVDGVVITGAERYVLQQFRPLGTLDPALQSVSPHPLEMLRQMAERARQWVEQVVVRGMDSPVE